MTCCKECLNHPCPYEVSVEERQKGARAAGYILLSGLMLLVFMLFGFVACALADDMDIARDAAWYAYHDKKVVTKDGVLDCDDNALKALRYMNERGVYPHVQICRRKGEGHVYLTYNGYAIDNTAPRLISVAAVKCDN